MRMRALPQSMWQEPNIPHNVSPATVYPVLPPLVTREGDDITGASKQSLSCIYLYAAMVQKRKQCSVHVNVMYT